MVTKRSYEDGCACAHALDLVGERWALLVVRELLLGPRRFTDLRAGLPHVSPNVLSQRLRELEASGVLTRRKLPPPAASWVYQLTDWGLQLEPIVQQLGRWGAQSPLRPGAAPIGLSTLVMALRTMFSSERAGTQSLRIDLQVGDERFGARVEGGQLEVGPIHDPTPPDAVIVGDQNLIGAVVLGGRPLAEALDAGDLQVLGDRQAAERFASLFPMPAVVQAPGAATPQP